MVVHSSVLQRDWRGFYSFGARSCLIASKVEVAASLAKRHLGIQGSGIRIILVMKSGQVKEGIEGDVGGKLKPF